MLTSKLVSKRSWAMSCLVTLLVCEAAFLSP